MYTQTQNPEPTYLNTPAQPGSQAVSPIVLVAEDDELLRQAMLTLLGDVGLNGIGAADGTELLGWVEPLFTLDGHGRSPDILITDLRMPGIDAIPIIEGLARLECLPVIVVTGMRDPQLREHLTALGCTWLQKPVAALPLERALLRSLADVWEERRL